MPLSRRRRLGRILLNALTGLSLLLWAATVALWVRSYTIADSLAWGAARQARLLVVSLDRGTLEVHSYYTYGEGFKTADDLQYPFGGTGLNHRITGYRHTEPSFHAWHRQLARYRHFFDDWRLGFPCWLAACAFAVGPALRWLAWALWPKRTKPTTVCPCCGYDLRATPDRCPECGTKVGAA